MKKGIDLSHNNATINWPRVKAAGVDFAILRAGFGWDNDSQIDRQLAANIKGCEAVGMPYGFYHYSYAKNPQDAQKEAQFLLRIIKGSRPAYPLFFDFEEAFQVGGVKDGKTEPGLPLEQQLLMVESFLGQVEAAHYFGGLYMSASPLQRLYRYSPDRVGRYAAWVAHIKADKPAFEGKYGLWQYSWEGKVDGITTPVDLNYAYLDYPAIIKAAGKNGWNKENTPPGQADDTVSCAACEALKIQLAKSNQQYEAARAKAERFDRIAEIVKEQGK